MGLAMGGFFSRIPVDLSGEYMCLTERSFRNTGTEIAPVCHEVLYLLLDSEDLSLSLSLTHTHTHRYTQYVAVLQI